MLSLKKEILISISSRNSLDMRLAFAPYLLPFKEPGGTSRGIMTEKPTFLLKVFDERQPEKFGIGEAAVFPGLSPEADGNYVNKLIELVANVALGIPTDLLRYSSIQFGLEQALLDYSNGCRGIYFPGEFTDGRKEIEINGLIWMGDYDKMLERIREKVDKGFKCLKMKIGAIDWNKELDMLRYVRKHFEEKELMIRVDANGGFTHEKALDKLKELAALDVHSIEQPIRAGMPKEMSKLCREAPVPIALDEELIGKNTTEEKEQMLDDIKPQYIILKPALCGGFSGGAEWIELSEKRGIGWWVTSALESNIGLNAIAQWTASVGAKGPQGLGTGGVFTDNFFTPIHLHGDYLRYDSAKKFNYTQFANLRWQG